MLKPLNRNVLIEVHKEEKKTASGIYLTMATGNDMTDTGVIISVGRDVVVLNAGDKVVFPKGIGVRVNHDDKEYLVIKEQDILATEE